ncbi:putative amino acid permease YhdG [Pleomorphomonas sp. T1.2MG-36]|uniref:APC family permease n=1 Tax=Pleomorphomonas sp. T1.2MG-36 TaxID=3041167 RepID=UPI00247754BA|nr:APC family permease [Pleomorphomonas sp. T1.2MG-36]CAI9404025.1 putative amino acid permease YhdG [Pleomorphomonas sp. T1.2MG-36]
MAVSKITRNTDSLKKELSLPMVFCVALKQVIGGGVIALTGVAIGLTGAGVPLAYTLAALTSIMAGIPFAIMSSAMPVTGGTYTWPTRLLSPVAGFLTLWFFFLTNVALSLYAITAADYISVFYEHFPAWLQLPKPLLAFFILTLFYLLNLSGSKSTAKVGMVLTLIMASAILLFIVTGAPEIQATNFSELLPNGFNGLISAAGILLFTTGGAAMVGELGGEMKNPGRDIPIAIIGATGLAAVAYVLASSVAAGVLPIPDVANKPLTLVAEHVMSRGQFLYFSIGAGIVSVLGIINAQMLWGSKSLLVACDDNWLPRKLASVNKRFGTPHYLLTLLYLIGILPIALSLSVKEISIAAGITGVVAQIVVIVCCFMLYRNHKGIYDNATFKVRSKPLLMTIIAIAFLLNCFLVIMMFINEASAMTAMLICGWMVVGVIISVIRRKGILENTIESAAVGS